MQGFAPCDGGVRVGLFVGLCERVEETPCVPGCKFRMCGISPVTEDGRDLAGRDGPAIRRPDHEVVGSPFGETHVPVGSDARFHADEAFAELSHRTSGELTEIPDSKTCVFASDLDEAGKREIVADENPGASHEAGREGFIMRVA